MRPLTETEIMVVEVITTPMRKYAKIDFYDLLDLSEFPAPAFIESEFFGESFYFYEYTPGLQSALEAMSQRFNIYIRYKHTNCPRFHDESWQQTNNIKAA